MANKIFTNGEEGKILTSVGNRIIKQPYEFGNALKIYPSYNLDLIENVPFSLVNHSFIYILFDSESPAALDEYSLNKITLADNSRIEHIKREAGLQNAIMRTLYYNVAGTNFLSDNDATFGGGKNNYGIYMVTFEADNNSFLKTYRGTVGINTKTETQFVASGKTSNHVKKMQLNYGASTNVIGSKLAEFLVFDRKINTGEFMYKYNNGSFNDVQSEFGLKYYFKMQKCESITYEDGLGGTQTGAGIVNLVDANKSLVFTNLPAGTLQQKIDYANANLFVPFI